MSVPRLYPALEIAWPQAPQEAAIGELLAAVDDHDPTAVEDTPRGCRVFFANRKRRDEAIDAAERAAPDASVAAVDVSDDAWAERSQAALEPVTVGQLTIAPPWSSPPAGADLAHWITIQPSMGFGTGHHQSTRLCLDLLQQVPPTGARVLDVGTGSGVLAIAAARLGASSVVAVDYDADAIDSARENVARNDVAPAVTLRNTGLGVVPDVDWDEPSLPPGGLDQEARAAIEARAASTQPAGPRVGYDLVLANLTGATLLRLAAELAQSLSPGSALIMSGFQLFERDAVAAGFAAWHLSVEREVAEDTWVGMRLTNAQRR